MPLKTWSAGDQVNAADLNTTIQDAIKNVTYELNAGETIDGSSDPVPVYTKADDNELYKTDASFRDERVESFAGFILNSTSDGNEARLQTNGVVEFTSAFTLNESVGERDDQQIDGYGGTNFDALNATTKYFSIGFKSGHKAGNISKVVVAFTTGSPVGITAVADIYAMDHSTGKPTGSALGTSSGVSITTTADFTFTFGTAVEIAPDTEYCIVIRLTAYGSGTAAVGGSNSGANAQHNYAWVGMPTTVLYFSTDSGSSWGSVSGGTYPRFTVHTTQNQHRCGDDVYLSETAGSVTLTLPNITSASIKKISKLLDANRVLIDQSNRVFLGETKEFTVLGSGTSDTRARAYFHAPARALYAEVKIDIGTEDAIYPINKGESLTIEDQSNSISVDWVNGVIEIDSDSATSMSITASVKFYS